LSVDELLGCPTIVLEVPVGLLAPGTTVPGAADPGKVAGGLTALPGTLPTPTPGGDVEV
jgi:hypothetical protein